MKPDGGPAFPMMDQEWKEHGGMSLRDWFAGMALQGMTAGLTSFCEDEISKAAGIIVNRPRDISEISYLYADAMLKERKKS